VQRTLAPFIEVEILQHRHVGLGQHVHDTVIVDFLALFHIPGDHFQQLFIDHRLGREFRGRRQIVAVFAKPPLRGGFRRVLEGYGKIALGSFDADRGDRPLGLFFAAELFALQLSGVAMITAAGRVAVAAELVQRRIVSVDK
jgi:hypothetical protein